MIFINVGCFLVVLTIGFESIDHVLNIPAINSHPDFSFNNFVHFRVYIDAMCAYVQVNTYHIYFILSCLFFSYPRKHIGVQKRIRNISFSSIWSFFSARKSSWKTSKDNWCTKNTQTDFFHLCARRSFSFHFISLQTHESLQWNKTYISFSLSLS